MQIFLFISCFKLSAHTHKQHPQCFSMFCMSYVCMWQLRWLEKPHVKSQQLQSLFFSQKISNRHLENRNKSTKSFDFFLVQKKIYPLFRNLNFWEFLDYLDYYLLSRSQNNRPFRFQGSEHKSIQQFYSMTHMRRMKLGLTGTDVAFPSIVFSVLWTLHRLLGGHSHRLHHLQCCGHPQRPIRHLLLFFPPFLSGESHQPLLGARGGGCWEWCFLDREWWESRRAEGKLGRDLESFKSRAKKWRLQKKLQHNNRTQYKNVNSCVETTWPVQVMCTCKIDLLL